MKIHEYHNTEEYRTAKGLKLAFDQGILSYETGISPYDNPFNPDSDRKLFYQWKTGFEYASRNFSDLRNHYGSKS